MQGLFCLILYVSDNFFSQSSLYAQYRPQYPRGLFEFLMSVVNKKELAWDCATGNGQAAESLSAYFTTVYATDISENQLSYAVKKPNIVYSCQPAEKTNFADNSFDLVTVSQALHWLNLPVFYEEVKRVAKKDAVFAAWTYSLPLVSAAIDEQVHQVLYKEILGGYWDAQRIYVDQQYSTIPFPYKEIPNPGFIMEYYWSLQQMEGYISSWSAVQKFIRSNNYKPFDRISESLHRLWVNEKMKIVFPISMRAGLIEK
jgi:ubiquinone/menaquinone biosynthesis C-methylase UbiE